MSASYQTSENTQAKNHLQRPGITCETLELNAIRHVCADEAERLCGTKASGLWIPYYDMQGRPVQANSHNFGRLRLDKPGNGHKYLQGVDTGQHCFIPAPIRSRKCITELILVEGEFKSLALSEAGYDALGLGGLNGLFQKGSTAFVPELQEVLDGFNPGQIYFVGDSDTAFNWLFAVEAVKLAEKLDVRIYLPRIPLDHPKGVDDCRETMGDDFNEWWMERMANALVVQPDDDRGDVALNLVESEIPSFAALRGKFATRMQARLGWIGASLEEDPLRYNHLEKMATRVGIGKRQLAKLVNNHKEKVKAENEKNETDNANLGSLLESKDYAQLISAEGAPHSVGNHGISLNTQFHVRKFAIDHLVLYYPAAASFYEYNAENGLWEATSTDVVKAQFSDDLIGLGKEAELQQEYAERRTDATLSGLVSSLRGVVEKKDPFARESTKQFVHAKNGVLDFSDDEPKLYDFSPWWYSRNQTPVSFDEKADCPKFLNDVLRPQLDEEDIDLLQRWAGLALLGGNPAQKFLILTGPANTGKGTVSEVIQEVIGRSNCCELRTEQLTERFEIGRFLDKRLLVGSDVPGNFMMHPGASTLKKLVGHDFLSGEVKNANKPVELRGDFDALINCNSRLIVRLDGDVSAWRRRMMILRFEGSPPGHRVANLSSVLFHEEGPGILNWMLRGTVKALKQLHAGEFVMAEKHRKEVEALLGESDSIRHFVTEALIPSEGNDLAVNEVGRSYVAFCTERGWQAKPQNTLQRELPDLLLNIHGTGKCHNIRRGGKETRGWRGITVREEYR